MQNRPLTKQKSNLKFGILVVAGSPFCFPYFLTPLIHTGGKTVCMVLQYTILNRLTSKKILSAEIPECFSGKLKNEK